MQGPLYIYIYRGLQGCIEGVLTMAHMPRRGSAVPFLLTSPLEVKLSRAAHFGYGILPSGLSVV